MSRKVVNLLLIPDDGTPKPGSPEAREMGCKCPILHNAYGKGFRGEAGLFLLSMKCPIHEVKDEKAD